MAHVRRLEQVAVRSSAPPPIRCSFRCGRARSSRCRMMDTILNLGLNDEAVEGSRRGRRTAGSPTTATAASSRCSATSSSRSRRRNRARVRGVKRAHAAKVDRTSPSRACRRRWPYKKLVQRETGKPFRRTRCSSCACRADAVFAPEQPARDRLPADLRDPTTSHGRQRPADGVRQHRDRSATGVGFTRNPATGAKEFFGEFLVNAQGEDVVAGIRTPRAHLRAGRVMPNSYKELRQFTSRLEKHYKDIQDFEFTIENDKLFMLQTRSGKRTGYPPSSSPPTSWPRSWRNRPRRC